MARGRAPCAQSIIGDTIRRLRERQGVTQQQLALDAGISYQHLCGIERGHENFSIRMLERIATALNLSVASVVAVAYRVDPIMGFARSPGGGVPALSGEAQSAGAASRPRPFVG